MAEGLAGQRVLVTGGLGFIGSNLVIELVQRGAQVSIVDLPDAGCGANRFNIAPVQCRVALHELDIRDSERLEPLVRRQDVICCLAGQVSHAGSMQQPLLDLELNCSSVLALLEYCRRENPEVRLLLASTRQLYGRPSYLPVDEQHVTRPVDVNGISKLAAEQLLRLYFENYGLRSVALRLTNTYGPRMDLRSRGRGFVNVALSRALRGQPIELYGTGQQRRDFSYVSDVVDAMLLAVETKAVWGKALNVAHPEHYSLNEFVDILNLSLPTACRHVPFPKDLQAIDVGDYYGSASQLQELTGWQPRVSLSAGLQQTVAWFRQHHEHYL